MRKVLLVFVIITLLAPAAFADNKSINLGSKKLHETESLLKSHGINVSITKGNKVILKNDKDGYTSSLILLTRNLDNKKAGVYFLHYKKDKLIKILWMEGDERKTGEKIISSP
jgi:hypothetical protein